MEKKCVTCGSTENVKEKQMPGIGIQGGIYICDVCDQKIQDTMDKGKKPKSSPQ